MKLGQRGMARNHLAMAFLLQILGLDGPQARQVAPVAIGIHAEADDEAVRDDHADDVGLYRFLLADGLVGKHGQDHFGGAHVQQALLDVRQGFAFVQDIVEHDHGAARHIRAGMTFHTTSPPLSSSP
jgi:hypothetical protein